MTTTRSTYFGFAVADGMFPAQAKVTRKVITVEVVREMVAAGVKPALNPTHKSTIDAMRSRFGIEVEIPEKAPLIKLVPGDQVVVMSVRGLPRREDGKGEYTPEEIAAATFEFSLWEVLPEDTFVVSGSYLRAAQSAQVNVAGSVGMDVGVYALDHYAKFILAGDFASADALTRLFRAEAEGKIQMFGYRPNSIWIVAEGHVGLQYPSLAEAVAFVETLGAPVVAIEAPAAPEEKTAEVQAPVAETPAS